MAVAVVEIALDTVEHDPRLLSDHERSRAQAFRHAVDARRFTALHATLRRLLAERAGIRPQDLELLAGPHGKPYVANAPLEFNISRSRERALVAISVDGDVVGVDLEYAEPLPDLALLIEQCGAPPEVRTNVMFYTWWTTVEATVKYHGATLADGLEGRSLLPVWTTPLPVAEGWIGALAAETPLSWSFESVH